MKKVICAMLICSASLHADPFAGEWITRATRQGESFEQFIAREGFGPEDCAKIIRYNVEHFDRIKGLPGNSGLSAENLGKVTPVTVFSKPRTLLVPKSSRGPKAEEEEKSAMKLIQISDIKAEKKYGSVTLKVKNHSAFTLRRVVVTVFYLDNSGKAFFEYDASIFVHCEGYSFCDSAPLRPNYSKVDTVYAGDGLDREEWSGEVRVELKKVEIERAGP